MGGRGGRRAWGIVRGVAGRMLSWRAQPLAGVGSRLTLLSAAALAPGWKIRDLPLITRTRVHLALSGVSWTCQLGCVFVCASVGWWGRIEGGVVEVGVGCGPPMVGATGR